MSAASVSPGGAGVTEPGGDRGPQRVGIGLIPYMNGWRLESFATIESFATQTENTYALFTYDGDAAFVT
jgi:hypothetical protein